MQSRYSNSVWIMSIGIIKCAFFCWNYLKLYLYGMLYQQNWRNSRKLSKFVLNDKALVVTPHITKYICYYLSLCYHLLPSVCLPIFPSVARLKPIRIPSNRIVCVPLFHLSLGESRSHDYA